MTNHLLRHFLATLSHRITHAIKNAPEDYPTFECGKEVRKPVELLNHITFLMAYVIHCYNDYEIDDFRIIRDWESEVARFYDTLEQLDQILAREGSPHKRSVEQLFQGPFADAMTHVGQLILIRRLADSSVAYENYMTAPIEAGKIRPHINK